jgi:hypothetical protein
VEKTSGKGGKQYEEAHVVFKRGERQVIWGYYQFCCEEDRHEVQGEDEGG